MKEPGKTKLPTCVWFNPIQGCTKAESPEQRECDGTGLGFICFDPAPPVGKPALGAAPAWLKSEERIRELANAILRNLPAPDRDIRRIRVWAKEIAMQCEIITMEAEEPND